MHAHWLPSALAALKTGKPYVVQLWGTDVELARKAPWLFRPLLRRARLAIVASEYLADAAKELGARDVRVVPSGVEIPEAVGDPDEPPHASSSAGSRQRRAYRSSWRRPRGCRV